MNYFSKITISLILLLSNSLLRAQTEIEPNNNFDNANVVEQETVINASLSTVNDIDYFKSLPKDDGKIVLHFSYENAPGNTNFSVNVYNRTRGNIGSRYFSANAAINDSLVLFCRQADTLYFRFSATTVLDYRFSYSVTSSGEADSESNNTFEDATLFEQDDTVKGRVGYNGSQIDFVDFFKTKLPDDGTLRIFLERTNTSNVANPSFTLISYNNAVTRGQIGSSILTNHPPGVLRVDTIDIPCRAADTVFFRLSAQGGTCFSYSLRYEMISSGQADLEPNDTREEAVEIEQGEVARGRVGYRGSGLNTVDFFKTRLPDDGTLRIYFERTNTSTLTDPNISFITYGINPAPISNITLSNNLPGMPVLDTIDIFCRAADTVFFRISSGGTSCFSYAFWYEVIASGENDVEPNNSFQEATSINLTDTVRGRLGYTSATRDAIDFYKLLISSQSVITVTINYNNTSNGNSSINTAFFEMSGTPLLTRNFQDLSPGSGTISYEFNCTPADSVYYRITTSGAACLSYEITFQQRSVEPEAEIFSSRMGNTFAFVAESPTADGILWNFGDGTTSTSRLPVKEFSIGEYLVQLQAQNIECSITNTVNYPVTIEGIEYYTPLRAGNSGNVGYFNLRIFGGGLNENTVVRLIQGSTVLTPFKVGSPSGAELNTLFNFAGSVVGTYDVEITLSSGERVLFPNGFEIFTDTKPYDISVVAAGRNTIRTGLFNDFTLNVTNNTARVANGVVAVLLLPDGVETNLEDVIGTETGSFVMNTASYNDMTIPNSFFNTIYFDGNFNPSAETFAVNNDEINALRNEFIGIDIDSLFDEPYSGNIYYIYVPLINANSTHTINFKLRSTANANLKILSYAYPYNLRQNPMSVQTLDYVHTAGLQAAAIAELAPNPALQAVGKSAGYVDVASQVAFTEFFDWYYGVNNADAEFYAKQSLSLGATFAGSKTPFGGKYTNTLNKVNVSKNALRNRARISKIDSDVLSWTTDPAFRNRLINELERNKQLIEGLGPEISDLQKQLIMDGLKKWGSFQGINLTKEVLEDLLFDDDPKSNKPNKIEKLDVRSITSFDPNEIYGPAGYNNEHYISKERTLPYLVTFENADTALAPAQIVKVIVDLDTNIYDIRQTWLGDVSIAENVYFFEQNRNSYFRDIDLRPAQDLIVRVNAAVDTIAGRLEWVFTSLDPATMDLTDNPLDGFLPPNVNMPEGEGSITFTTKLKSDVGHNEELSAYAAIYFDQNEPILTSTWRNVVDDKAPATVLSPSVTIEQDSIMVLSVTGADAESGLENYLLFAKINDKDWWREGMPVSLNQEFRIIGSPGITYAFYVQGVDSVGNSEVKPQEPEAVVSLVTNISENRMPSQMLLFPNPTTGTLHLRPFADGRDVTIAVMDISGRLILARTQDVFAGEDIRLSLSGVTDGIYIVQLRNAGGVYGSGKFVLAR